MTKLSKKKKRCGLCGSVNDYIVVCSTSAFGSPDLDTRPSQLKRSTIIACVKRCPECGYCASDIRKIPHQAKTVVYSSKYTRQLVEESKPELANSFLCKALIDHASGDYSGAAWAHIHVAWVCDDVKKQKAARKCRDKAIDMITKSAAAGQLVSEEDGEDTVIQADLLSRAGHIAEAKKFVADKRSEITNHIITKLLDFQYYLIFKDDISCHTIAEAIGENEWDK